MEIDKKRAILIVASVASMIDQFIMPNIELLQAMGYQVDVACNFDRGNTCSQEQVSNLKNRLTQIGVDFFQIDFSREIYNVSENCRSFRQLNQVAKGKKYDFIHCHSPIGGALGRIVGRINHIKVIYTAHGFHFCKGVSLKNWIAFYPVEWLLSFLTDMLIAINLEDFERAVKHFHAKRTIYIPGVGIDIERFSPVREEGSRKVVEDIREKLDIPKDTRVLLSVGELSHRKNHATVIKALGKIQNLSLVNWVYVIVGMGPKEKELKELASSLGIGSQVKFLGFRSDAQNIYKMADFFVFPSYREGLPVALMEAMASGLPVVCSRIRGNTDLIDAQGGYLIEPQDVKSYAEVLHAVLDRNQKKVSEERLKEMSQYNKAKIKSFSNECVKNEMLKVYEVFTKSNN